MNSKHLVHCWEGVWGFPQHVCFFCGYHPSRIPLVRWLTDVCCPCQNTTCTSVSKLTFIPEIDWYNWLLKLVNVPLVTWLEYISCKMSVHTFANLWRALCIKHSHTFKQWYKHTRGFTKHTKMHACSFKSLCFCVNVCVCLLRRRNPQTSSLAVDHGDRLIEGMMKVVISSMEGKSFAR